MCRGLTRGIAEPLICSAGFDFKPLSTIRFVTLAIRSISL
jgi:hypothetical protein